MKTALGFLATSQSTWGTNSAVVRSSVRHNACSISGAADPSLASVSAEGTEAARVGGLLKHRNRVRNEEWDADVVALRVRTVFGIKVNARLRQLAPCAGRGIMQPRLRLLAE